MIPDWIVERITLTKEARQFGRNAWYRLHVQGRNLSSNGELFRWTVQDVANPRYDLTNAEVELEALSFLERDLEVK